MGIRNLWTTLEPWADSQTIRGVRVVMDGPAFAYHIVNVLVSNGVPQPSGKQLAQAATAWVDKLTSQEITIDAIYFDGYLPETKLQERLERSVKSAYSFARGRSDYRDGWHRCPRSSCHDEKPPLIPMPAGSSHPQAVTPAFLVPVVLDALLTDPAYKEFVHVIPGEADSFCASRVKAVGGVLLTDDSDLLVHDLGNGRVARFREIRENENEKAEDPDSWLFRVYDVPNILKRTGLSPTITPLRLGYEMRRNGHGSFNTIIASCRRDLIQEREQEAFDKFRREYATLEIPLPLTLRGNTLNISTLDPRVSELVLQLGLPDTESISSSGPRMFFPPISEDSLLGSPWVPSTPIRQLAYTIYTWVLPDSSRRALVREFRRVQTIDHPGKITETMSKAVALNLAKVLLGYISQLKTMLGRTDTTLWTFLGLIIDVKDCLERDRQHHCLTVLKPSSNYIRLPANHDKIPWDVAQFTGHLQAAFYSLRMLRQILTIIPQDELSNLPAEVAQLRIALSDLTEIAEFPDWESTMEFLRTCPQVKPLEIINRLIELPEWATAVGSEVKDQRARKKRKASDQQPPARKPTNPFSLLQEE